MKRFSFIISGMVQGVFFRKYTQQKASELNLKGFVKNLDNGKVYVEAEGEADALRAFEAWCNMGSPMSQVASVTRNEIPLRGDLSFEIISIKP